MPAAGEGFVSGITVEGDVVAVERAPEGGLRRAVEEAQRHLLKRVATRRAGDAQPGNVEKRAVMRQRRGRDVAAAGVIDILPEGDGVHGAGEGAEDIVERAAEDRRITGAAVSGGIVAVLRMGVAERGATIEPAAIGAAELTVVIVDIGVEVERIARAQIGVDSNGHSQNPSHRPRVKGVPSD